MNIPHYTTKPFICQQNPRKSRKGGAPIGEPPFCIGVWELVNGLDVPEAVGVLADGAVGGKVAGMLIIRVFLNRNMFFFAFDLQKTPFCAKILEV